MKNKEICNFKKYATGLSHPNPRKVNITSAGVCLPSSHADQDKAGRRF